MGRVRACRMGGGMQRAGSRPQLVEELLCAAGFSLLRALAGASVTLDCFWQDLGLDPIVSNLELEKVDPNLRALTQATQGALLRSSLVWSAVRRGHFSHSARAGVATVACRCIDGHLHLWSKQQARCPRSWS